MLFLLGLSVSLASCAMAPCPLPVGDERSRRTRSLRALRRLRLTLRRSGDGER